jgi:hypothetical protein
MNQTTAHNHFIPRAYLRNWSQDGKKVFTYSLLVPHENVPEWDLKSIRSLAAHEHLYTATHSGAESDAFENWIKEEIEDPAAEVLRKVATDVPLNRRELESLVRYAAALDRRTPASYLEQKARWEAWLPELLQDTLNRLPKALAKAAKAPPPARDSDPSDPLLFPLPVRVWTGAPDREDLVPLHTEVTAGRGLWLHSLHRTLTTTYRVLLKHHWSIVRPYRGTEWFTSDHPVVRLNFYDEGNYDFGGGWGNRGSEFLLPLSPHHLLYTKVGYRAPPEIQASADLTAWIQRFVAERAARAIYAREPLRRIEWYRTRRIDAHLYREEQEAWASWHTEQGRAERSDGSTAGT